jgi:hypothetical protein
MISTLSVGAKQSSSKRFWRWKEKWTKKDWRSTKVTQNIWLLPEIGLSRARLFVTKLLVTSKNLEIQRRIQTANRCFFALRKQLQPGHLSRPTKFIIFKTLILQDLLYMAVRPGCWPKGKENQLLVIERKVLRTICGQKLENGVYRRRYNFELQ